MRTTYHVTIGVDDGHCQVDGCHRDRKETIPLPGGASMLLKPDDERFRTFRDGIWDLIRRVVTDALVLAAVDVAERGESDGYAVVKTEDAQWEYGAPYETENGERVQQFGTEDAARIYGGVEPVRRRVFPWESVPEDSEP